MALSVPSVQTKKDRNDTVWVMPRRNHMLPAAFKQTRRNTLRPAARKCSCSSDQLFDDYSLIPQYRHDCLFSFGTYSFSATSPLQTFENLRTTPKRVVAPTLRKALIPLPVAAPRVALRCHSLSLVAPRLLLHCLSFTLRSFEFVYIDFVPPIALLVLKSQLRPANTIHHLHRRETPCLYPPSIHDRCNQRHRPLSGDSCQHHRYYLLNGSNGTHSQSLWVSSRNCKLVCSPPPQMPFPR